VEEEEEGKVFASSMIYLWQVEEDRGGG